MFEESCRKRSSEFKYSGGTRGKCAFGTQSDLISELIFLHFFLLDRLVAERALVPLHVLVTRQCIVEAVDVHITPPDARDAYPTTHRNSGPF
jgi:hypothetical protein